MSQKKIPVILDTDIGYDIDDTWALGLILQCHELDVKLITTVSQDTHIKAILVAKFLEFADRTDIPIGIGSSNDRSKSLLYDWIKDYRLSSYPGMIHENGIEAICDTTIKSPEPITLIAIGPLGNIADAIKLDPDIIWKARFVGMQGSLRIGYKGNPAPVAEYNVLYNSKACRDVFNASWEKTITPLDTCGNIRLSSNNFKRFMNCDKIIPTLIKENYEIWARKRGLSDYLTKKNTTPILYDTVAIYLAFSEELLNIENLKIEVTDNGFTEIGDKGNNIRCAVSWKDIQAFKNLIVDRLVS
jgi:inosine-uridine nucleoside N-ribohydrolase